jgi:hypothetical protein
MQWLAANYLQLIVAILAIDSALIPIFPKLGLLGTIKNWLSPLAPKS